MSVDCTLVPRGDSAAEIPLTQLPFAMDGKSYLSDDPYVMDLVYLLQLHPITMNKRQALRTLTPLFTASPRVSSITSRIASLMSTLSLRGRLFQPSEVLADDDFNHSVEHSSFSSSVDK